LKSGPDPIGPIRIIQDKDVTNQNIIALLPSHNPGLAAISESIDKMTHVHHIVDHTNPHETLEKA
jgi:hypothetical protein